MHDIQPVRPSLGERKIDLSYEPLETTSDEMSLNAQINASTILFQIERSLVDGTLVSGQNYPYEDTDFREEVIVKLDNYHFEVIPRGSADKVSFVLKWSEKDSHFIVSRVTTS